MVARKHTADILFAPVRAFVVLNDDYTRECELARLQLWGDYISVGSLVCFHSGNGLHDSLMAKSTYTTISIFGGHFFTNS